MKSTLALLALVVLASAITGCGIDSPKLHGTVLEPPLSATDYALTDQDGQTTRLSDFRGSPVLLFFGYTHCPDVCPLTLAHFKQIRSTLGADGARVRFVFVTVDPERDTPARIKEYLANFDPSFVGLTASPETLAQVYRAFGITVANSQPSAYSPHHVSNSVDHTRSVFLLDDQGKVRVIYAGIAWQDIASDVHSFLSNLAKVRQQAGDEPSQGWTVRSE